MQLMAAHENNEHPSKTRQCEAGVRAKQREWREGKTLAAGPPQLPGWALFTSGTLQGMAPGVGTATLISPLRKIQRKERGSRCWAPLHVPCVCEQPGCSEVLSRAGELGFPPCGQDAEGPTHTQ